MKKLDKLGLNYRKEIWGILKEFRNNKKMTLEEVTDKIMALPTPKEIKNPYVALATRIDEMFTKEKK